MVFPSPVWAEHDGPDGGLEKLTLDLCKTDWSQRYHARDAILAVAGNVEFEPLKSEVEKHFGDLGWPADAGVSGDAAAGAVSS